MNKCVIPGCTRKHHRRGWCAMHYMRWYRHGSPYWERPPKPTCQREDCDKPSKTHGLCQKHYQALARTQPGNSQASDYRRKRYAKRRGVRKVACKNPECGRDFVVPNKQGNPPGFCSEECRRRAAVLRAKAWCEANPERSKELRKAVLAKYGALKRGATPPGEIFTLDEIYERDRGLCWLCGRHVEARNRSMDHVVPVSKGGAHSRANVKLAHRRCNARKNARVLATT